MRGPVAGIGRGGPGLVPRRLRPAAGGGAHRHLAFPNGYDTLLAATKREVPRLDGITASPLKPSPPQPLEGRKKLLQANQPAIAQLRQALEQEYLVPPTDAAADDYPRFAAFREMARMLHFASGTYADSGNHPEAARCSLDSIQMSVMIPRGGLLIPGMAGTACEAIGQSSLWKQVDRLDAPTARAAARRLAAIDKQRWPIAETLQGEQRNYASTVRMVFAGGPGTGTWDSLDIFVRNAVIARTQEPWGARRPLPAALTDPLSREQLAFLADVDYKWVHAQAYGALLETYLALRAYRLERGAYPHDLVALVGAGYLETLPTDAFLPTRSPLRYRRETTDRIRLWSVGPDARDDNGRAGLVADSDGKPRRGFVNQDATGDIVARINTW